LGNLGKRRLSCGGWQLIEVEIGDDSEFELKLEYDGFHLYHHKDYTTYYDVDKLS
jgi:hypothetical protein